MNVEIVTPVIQTVIPDISEGSREFTVRLDSVQKEVTKEGFYKFYNVPVARSGYFDYAVSEVEHDGALLQGYKRGQILKGYRPKETFTDEVVKSIQGMPLTITHPKQGLATPENVKNHGAIIAPYLELASDGEVDLYISEVILHSKEIISAYDGGMKELSIGFFYKKPVEWVQGKNFNFIEDIIKINHLALVPKGRAGYGYRLHKNLEVDKGMEGQEIITKLNEVLTGFAASFNTNCSALTDTVGRLNAAMEKKAKDEEDDCSAKKNKKAKTDAETESKTDADKDDGEGEDKGRKNDVFYMPMSFMQVIAKALPDNIVWGYSVGEKPFTGEHAPAVLQLFKNEASARNLKPGRNNMFPEKTDAEKAAEAAAVTRTNSTAKINMTAIGD